VTKAHQPRIVPGLKVQCVGDVFALPTWYLGPAPVLSRFERASSHSALVRDELFGSALALARSVSLATVGAASVRAFLAFAYAALYDVYRKVRFVTALKALAFPSVADSTTRRFFTLCIPRRRTGCTCRTPNATTPNLRVEGSIQPISAAGGLRIDRRLGACERSAICPTVHQGRSGAAVRLRGLMMRVRVY
jgi:hypothetical protein